MQQKQLVSKLLYRQHVTKMKLKPVFSRCIGIDYSGAETANSSCKGIRVFIAEDSGEPVQVLPPPSPRRYWTRRGLAEWLADELGCAWGLEGFAQDIEAIAEKMLDRECLNVRMNKLEERARKDSRGGVSARYIFKELRREQKATFRGVLRPIECSNQQLAYAVVARGIITVFPRPSVSARNLFQRAHLVAFAFRVLHSSTASTAEYRFANAKKTLRFTARICLFSY